MHEDIVIGEEKKTINWWLIVGVVLAGIIVIVGMGALIWSLLPKDYDKVRIVNRDELAEVVDGSEIDNFRQELLNLLRNDGVIGENDTVNDVVIREGTVTSQMRVNEEEGYWKTTTFLVDIDSLQRTYAVRIVGSDEVLDGVTAQISCPNKDETKYPDTKCIDLYGVEDNYLKYKLPHELRTATGDKVVVKKVETVKEKGEWVQRVQVYLYSCEKKTPPVAMAEEAVRKWVDGLNDPISDYYIYNIRTGYCEGDAI